MTIALTIFLAKVRLFFSRHKVKIFVACLIVVSVGTCGACKTTEPWTQFLNDFDESKLENSKDPIVAAFALCRRASAEKGTMAGENVRDCQPLLERILQKDELKTCFASGHLAQRCYRIIYDREKDMK